MKPKKPGNQLKNLAVLSGVAFQMGITIYLFVRLGQWLDGKYNDDGKLFVIICTLLGVAVSLYVVIRQLKNLKD